MKRCSGLLVAIGIGLACENADLRGGRSVRGGTAATRLALNAFAPNPQCTIAATWDPQVGAPSAEALAQLAPQGKVRMGIFTGNAAVAQQNATTGALTGPAIDLACRMGARLGLDVEFVTDASNPNFQARFRAGEFEIGFTADPTLAAADQSVAHPYIGVENAYLVPVDSSFKTSADVDQPGVLIAVPPASAPDAYLSRHLKYATLVRALSTSGNQSLAAFNLLVAGKVDAVATGRAGELTFIATSWPGQGRVLPDDIFVAELGPFMHPGNPDGVCWLSDFIEGAKASGLLAQAIVRSNTTVGRTVPASLPGCAPAARCRDVTIAADASCQGNASVNAASDDPDSDLVRCTQSPLGPYALGATPVTLTCTDEEGQTASCTATVTVVDTTPPSIVCPGDQMLECVDKAAVASFSARATDNCPGVAVQCTPPSGSTLADGLATTAACTAVDASGNRAGCGFAISVRDTLPPVVTPKVDANGFSLTLWPPDHTYRSVSLSDCIQTVVDRCDGALPVNGTILRVISDEPENGRGDGDTCDDIVITSDTTVRLRAERNGRGDGRVYSIFASVGDDDGNRTPIVCRVQVPRHRFRTPAIDSGAAYCVGQGCGSVPGHDRSCGHADDNEDETMRDSSHRGGTPM